MYCSVRLFSAAVLYMYTTNMQYCTVHTWLLMISVTFKSPLVQLHLLLGHTPPNDQNIFEKNTTFEEGSTSTPRGLTNLYNGYVCVF